MNKRSQTRDTIIFLLIFLVVIGWGIFLGIKIILISENDCLKELAEDYCEQRGWIYDYHWWGVMEIRFRCVENERNSNYLTFEFTKDEIEGCKK